jgi:hypothetical protein
VQEGRRRGSFDTVVCRKPLTFAADKTGQWGGHLFPEDLDASAHEAGVKTLMLMVRVRDDGIREMMKTFRDYANKVAMCRSEAEGQQALLNMVAVLEPLHERIGVILRKLDDDEEVIELERQASAREK